MTKYLAFLLILFTFARSFEQDHLLESLGRERRKATKTQDLSSSAVDYMVNLRNQLSDKNGRPKLSNSDFPTEIWATQDRGTVCNNSG